MGLFQTIARRLREARHPDRGGITLTPDGLDVSRHGETVAALRWDDVDEIVAYKLDLLTTDLINLEFHRRSDGEWCLRVDEEMHGFDRLMEEMERRFASLQPDWYRRVMLPPFETCQTIVWRRRREAT
jgi:hypothetical protein